MKRVFIGVACASLWLGCTVRSSAPLAGPLVLDTDQEIAGRAVYLRQCEQCHPGGESGMGPAIIGKPVGPVMRVQIRMGLGAMPSFDETVIPDAELEALAAYLEALEDRAVR